MAQNMPKGVKQYDRKEQMMSDYDDDEDKPTVVIDLNALKKQKSKLEEDLASQASELVFNVGEEEIAIESDDFSSDIENFPVICFDFQSDFFENSLDLFPEGFEYKIAKSLQELNSFLKAEDFQVVIFNYDVNSKAVNQLCMQIKQKRPLTKTLIMARSISPKKALIHAATASGADGYYEFPLEPKRIKQELVKIHSKLK